MSYGELKLEIRSNKKRGQINPINKYFTMKGVKYMLILLVMITIIHISILFRGLLWEILFTNGEVNSNVWKLIKISGLIITILYIAFIILLIVPIYWFNRGKDEFGNQHIGNVNWSKYLLLLLFFIFFTYFLIIPIIFYFNIDYSIFLTYSTFYEILGLFFLALLLFLIVSNFVNEFQKDLLIVFTTLIIFIPIIKIILELSFSINFNSLGTFDHFIARLLFSIGSPLFWFIAVWAYYQIFKSFDINGRYSQKRVNGFLPRPKYITDYINNFYTKPKFAIIIILIITIILSLLKGIFYIYSL